MKIAIFKPHNIRKTNAFGSGQQPVFLNLAQMGHEVTYFVDDKKVKFDGIKMAYVPKNEAMTLLLRAARKLLGGKKFYWKIPYYKNMDFSDYDVIITEGIHYIFLEYVKDIAGKVILNDSISRDFVLPKIQVDYLNKYFSKSLAVVVNAKIPLLYGKNKLNIKTEIIGHAVDTSKIPYIQRASCDGKFVSVGRLSPEKGFEYLVAAVARVVKTYPQATLTIYGDGPLRQDIMDLVASLHLQNNVAIKEFLPYNQLMGVLGQYDAFVSCPIETKQVAEAFSMANMEAMAAGLPVITTNCGGVPYVVGDKAIVVGQKNAQQIATAMENLMEDPQLVQRYSAEGRDFVKEHYSIEVIAKKWDMILKNHGKI